MASMKKGKTSKIMKVKAVARPKTVVGGTLGGVNTPMMKPWHGSPALVTNKALSGAGGRKPGGHQLGGKSKPANPNSNTGA